jgi:hypothetical protein
MIKIMKRIFRIPYVVIDKILVILFIFFALFQINEFLLDSNFLAFSEYNKSVTAGMGIMQFSPFYYSASAFPELMLKDPMTYLLLTTFFVSALFLYISSKLKYAGNNLLFTTITLLAFLFIILFKTFPFESPVLSDRMMGLNVIQWGLILTMVLMTAFLLARENNTDRHKREIMFKPPGEYRILVIYFIVSLISLQTAPLLNGLHIKLLFTGYFILTSYIIFYFMRKIERHYLKYGTVSIIILIFVFFLMAQIPSNEQKEDDTTEIALK